ncbi:MAG: heavy metal translocating P-type ATPase [Bdellovibrio sp.]|nr:heavy metal translocating P-type ATPase [Bdellovibrio sp.]
MRHALSEPIADQCLHCHDKVAVGELYCCHACEVLYKVMHESDFKEQLQHSYEKRNVYEHLDQISFEKLYRLTPNARNFIIYVGGLECSSCVHLLEKVSEFYPEISESRVHFSNSTLLVKLSTSAKLSHVLALIEELGYKPKILKSGESVRNQHKIENRKLLMRIGVAGAAAGNMMLYVVPIYSGLKGEMAQNFNWICFALFLPILFYSAVPFYRGAWNSLKHKVISVDLPITIALWLGFTVSTFNLITKQAEVYFDSTASFMFFILLARYLLRKVQQHYLFQPDFDDLIATEKIERVVGEQSEFIPTYEIQVGDLLIIRNQAVIPADGILQSEQAHLDLSLLTGESLPQRTFKNMNIFAGTKVFSDSVLIEVKATGSETHLGQLLAKLNSSLQIKTDFGLITDRLSQYLILIVLMTAVLFFAFYVPISFQQALNRTLALIVLACPCALAFGTPLAQGLALRKGKKMGLIIKNPSVLEKILKVENLFFDKTGTLTEGRLYFYQSFPSELSHNEKEIILGLENISFHPVAQNLRKQWGDVKPVAIHQAKENISEGVEGFYKGDFYQLKASSVSSDRGLMQVEFLKNDKRLAYLYFSDQLRPDSVEIVKELKKRFKQISVLSGDRSAEVLSVAEAVHLSKNNTYIGYSAEQKEALIRKTPLSCMIGDGSNDSLALQAADVGIAVSGSTDLSLSHADVYLTESGLKPILKLIALAEQAQRTIKINIGISLVYNSIGAVLALSGFISPMVAAILMPISSLLLILSTVLGLK